MSGSRDLVVRRRVLAWSPRWRGFRVREGADGDLDVHLPFSGWSHSFLEVLDDLIIGLLATIAIVLLVATVVPVVVLAVEVVLVLLITAAVLIGRIVLGHPWPVVARDRSTGETVGTWHVVGWRRAGRACENIRQRATFGAPLPPPGPWDPDAE